MVAKKASGVKVKDGSVKGVEAYRIIFYIDKNK